MPRKKRGQGFLCYEKSDCAPFSQFVTYNSLVKECGVEPLEHLIGGGQAQMVLHEALQTGTDHLLLLLNGAGCRGERVTLTFLGWGAVRWTLILVRGSTSLIWR